jgi:DNA polymerase III alpha subunit
MECFGERGQMLANLENYLAFHKELSKPIDTNQVSLFGAGELALKPKLKQVQSEAADNLTKLAWEKELLGLYVSEHPFSSYRPIIGPFITSLTKLKDIKRESEVKVGGIITGLKKILTKKNETMLFVKISDGLENLELLIFPKLYKETSQLWQEGQAILCLGTISDKDSETKILANLIQPLSLATVSKDLTAFRQACDAHVSKPNFKKFKKPEAGIAANTSAPQTTPTAPVAKSFVKLTIKQHDLTQDLLDDLKNVLLASPGDLPVFLVIINGSEPKVVPTDYRVAQSPVLSAQLTQVLGSKVLLAV